MRHLTYLILLFSAGCVDTGAIPTGDGGNNANCPMPTAADLNTKVFAVSCAFSSCHGPSPRAMLDLSSEQTACTSLASNTPSCEFPTMARTAVMLTKLKCASNDCTPDLGTPATSCATAAGGNARMPATGTVLEQCKIDALQMWITAGLTGCPAGP